MDVLWHPEKGFCPECGRRSKHVRGYSCHGAFRRNSEGLCFRLCFACWDRMQEGTVVSSREWREDVAIVFVEEPPARAGSRTRAEHAPLN